LKLGVLNAALVAVFSSAGDACDSFTCDCHRGLAVANSPAKVVLDLFERRMKVYSEIRAVIASIVSSGKLPNEKHFEFMRAIDDAKFIFGSKVNGYLEELDSTLAYFHEADETYGQLQGQERGEAIQSENTLTKCRRFTKTSIRSLNPILACVSGGPGFEVARAIK
jgi:hypothetical protein